MATAGIVQKLHLTRFTENGAYLMDENGDEVLLPRRYVSDTMHEGDTVEAFVYFDSEDRMVATTERPKLTLSQVGALEVVSSSRMGVFLDWGLPKDLFMPRANYRGDLHTGDAVVVAIERDNVSGRLVATTKLGNYVSNNNILVEKGEQVEIAVAERLERGFRVVINGCNWGMIYDDQLSCPVRTGDTLQGYITRITELGRIDVMTRKSGYDGVREASDRLFGLLVKNGGSLMVHDGSSPEEIAAATGMSKKLFKRALGGLLKEGRVVCGDEQISLK
ncbi:MAG: hypothetical protein K2N21_00215 [Rikenellaceae bacterium]|nr:hypothetical protein [Rikenellaceae bacterium]